jgi:hypothetical protein
MSQRIGKKGYFILAIIALVLASTLLGLFTKSRVKLKQLPYDKENELRQNWKNYIVYKRFQGIHTIALLYKIKNKKKIILPSDWIEITTGAEIEKSKIPFATNSAEILGPNDVLYGFLVYRSADRVRILEIDENTIRLYYHHIRTSKD